MVSLGTTLVTFVLTMVGAGDAVQGLKAIGSRVSADVKRISVTGHRVSAAGQRVSSVGQRINEVGSIAVPTIGASSMDDLPTIDALSKADCSSTQCMRTSNGGQVGRRSRSFGGQAQ